MVTVAPDGTKTGGQRVHFYKGQAEAEEKIRRYLLDPPQLRSLRESVVVEEWPLPNVDRLEKPTVARYQRVHLPFASATLQIRAPGHESSTVPGINERP